jgi:hypothetical protein
VFCVVELQVRVAVPEPVIVLGVIAPQVSPDGTVSVRVTTPANPLSAVTVMVEVDEPPAGTEAGDVAAMVKSTKLKVAVAVWTSGLLVPVMVRVYVPATVELHDTVAVPEPVTLVGVIAPHVRPDGPVSVRLTVPVNPFSAVTVIVEVADWVTSTAAGELAAMVKSTKLKVAVAVWTSGELVPVTVSV